MKLIYIITIILTISTTFSAIPFRSLNIPPFNHNYQFKKPINISYVIFDKDINNTLNSNDASKHNNDNNLKMHDETIGNINLSVYKQLKDVNITDQGSIYDLATFKDMLKQGKLNISHNNDTHKIIQITNINSSHNNLSIADSKFPKFIEINNTDSNYINTVIDKLDQIQNNDSHKHLYVSNINSTRNNISIIDSNYTNFLQLNEKKTPSNVSQNNDSHKHMYISNINSTKNNISIIDKLSSKLASYDILDSNKSNNILQNNDTHNKIFLSNINSMQNNVSILDSKQTSFIQAKQLSRISNTTSQNNDTHKDIKVVHINSGLNNVAITDHKSHNQKLNPDNEGQTDSTSNNNDSHKNIYVANIDTQRNNITINDADTYKPDTLVLNGDMLRFNNKDFNQNNIVNNQPLLYDNFKLLTKTNLINFKEKPNTISQNNNTSKDIRVTNINSALNNLTITDIKSTKFIQNNNLSNYSLLSETSLASNNNDSHTDLYISNINSSNNNLKQLNDDGILHNFDKENIEIKDNLLIPSRK